MTTWRHTQWRRTGILLAALATSCVLSIGRSGHEIRGQIVSRSSGQPVECTDPIVVLAIPVSDTPSPGSTTAVVRRADAALSPSFLVVPVGQSVRFVNEDDIYHSFFSSSEHNAFDLGLLDPGKSNKFRFKRPGPVQVYCSLHTGEQVTILVAPTPHFAVVGPTGKFAIGNLAPGLYILETWSEAFPPQREEVTVSPSGTKFVEVLVGELEMQGSG